MSCTAQGSAAPQPVPLRPAQGALRCCPCMQSLKNSRHALSWPALLAALQSDSAAPALRLLLLTSLISAFLPSAFPPSPSASYFPSFLSFFLLPVAGLDEPSGKRPRPSALEGLWRLWLPAMSDQGQPDNWCLRACTRGRCALPASEFPAAANLRNVFFTSPCPKDSSAMWERLQHASGYTRYKNRATGRCLSIWTQGPFNLTGGDGHSFFPFLSAFLPFFLKPGKLTGECRCGLGLALGQRGLLVAKEVELWPLCIWGLQLQHSCLSSTFCNLLEAPPPSTPPPTPYRGASASSTMHLLLVFPPAPGLPLVLECIDPLGSRLPTYPADETVWYRLNYPLVLEPCTTRDFPDFREDPQLWWAQVEDSYAQLHTIESALLYPGCPQWCGNAYRICAQACNYWGPDGRPVGPCTHSLAPSTNATRHTRAMAGYCW